MDRVIEMVLIRKVPDMSTPKTRKTAPPAPRDAGTPALSVPMGNLHTHPAQMRTVYDPIAMASLTLQVLHAGGVAAWHPLVATPRPEGKGYFIVSGHRRRMALLFSWAFADGHTGASEETVTLDAVQTFLETLLTNHSTVEEAAAALLPPYAERLVPIHLFEGDLKAQILALQQANYGADTPDPLGIAHSFHAALQACATERQIAHNAGVSLTYVKKHLALLRVPPSLANAITDNLLPLSMAEVVVDVPSEVARLGLAFFVVTNAAQVTIEGVRACVARLKAWDPFRTPPMTLAHQGQRNMIRILATLWDRAIQQDAPRAWASAALLLYRNISPHAPWESQSAYTEWVKSLGGEAYYRDPDGILWESLVRECLTEVTCLTCPVHTLPPTFLVRDLSDRPGVLGRPCRTREREHATRCINGFAPGDPIDVRVPFEWATHPGVTKQGSHYVVMGTEALEQAWLAQRDAETVVDPPEPTALAQNRGEGEASPSAQATPAPASRKRRTSPPETRTPVATPPDPVPVQEMRTLIRDYMARHPQMEWRHPFATPCATCQHHLEQSPTKDPTVPACAWAARLRTVRFSQLVSDDGTLQIPVCSQYASTWTWQDRIPVHTSPPPFPRDYMLAQIRTHARTRGGNPTFEFLTGRPMGPASYTDWFETQLQEAVGHLSDKQLFTLLVWSIAEHDRVGHPASFWLPADKHMTSFIPVREITWS